MMSIKFILVLIAAIVSGLAAFRWLFLGGGRYAGMAGDGLDVVCLVLCLYFVSILVGGPA